MEDEYKTNFTVISNTEEDLKLFKLSKTYKEETLAYVKAVNAYREEGMATQWQETPQMPLPEDTREKYDEQIYKIILKANKEGWVDKLRDLFPPQTEIFYSFRQSKYDMSNIHKIIAVNDKLFLAIIDRPKFYIEGNTEYIRECYICENGNFTKLPDIYYLGACPQKKILAYFDKNGIHLQDVSNGKDINFIPWHKNDIYFTDGTIAAKDVEISSIVEDICIPFSDGQKILIGGESHGLFLLEKNRITVIFPDKNYYDKYRDEHAQNKKPIDNILQLGDFPMLHCALSHNNRYIALGFQSSLHYIYDHNGNMVGSMEPDSSYPHYALFATDDEQVAFNSCHFYNGVTTATKVNDITNGRPYSDAIELDMESRVYAAVAASYGYIIGEAYGYIRARSYQGDHLWDDYLGFNIATMDITDDEQFLYVGTYKGIIYKIQLNSGTKDPYTIGNSDNKEICRWLFWEKDKILQW